MKQGEKSIQPTFFPPGQHPFLGSSSMRYDDMALQLAYMLPQNPHAAYSFPQPPLQDARMDSPQADLFPQQASTTSPDEPRSADIPELTPERSPMSEEPESSKSNTKSSTKAESVPPDPNAPAFLREMLGEIKYATFSAKLFERRLGGPKIGMNRKKKADGEEETGDLSTSQRRTRGSHGATVIEFLVKTEVVKEVLRTYVPHPYNPLKSLAHSYTKSPTGAVVLTRPTVLQLCGWSNTQFSYWARRSEAIACLSQYDERLAKVRAALEARIENGNWAVHLTNEEADAMDAAALASTGLATSSAEDIVTGKAVDAIVEQVKKRTGASQFIRGKHSSLDPFGKVLGDDFAHGLGRPPTSPKDETPIISSPTKSNPDLPELAGTGGGGGIRITDVRKRASEARKRGDPVPPDLVRAEEEARKIAAAKAMGKGKRGPGKSKGIAGGDNHGRGSAQEQLHAAAIIDMMQQGVLGGAGASSPVQQSQLNTNTGNQTEQLQGGQQADAIGGAGPSRQQTEFTPTPSTLMPTHPSLPHHEHTTPHFNGQPYTGLPNLFHHAPLRALAHQAEVHAHLMQSSRPSSSNIASAPGNNISSIVSSSSGDIGIHMDTDSFDPGPYTDLELSTMALIGIDPVQGPQHPAPENNNVGENGTPSSTDSTLLSASSLQDMIGPATSSHPAPEIASSSGIRTAHEASSYLAHRKATRGAQTFLPALEPIHTSDMVSMELESPTTSRSESYFLSSGPFSRLEESSERGCTRSEKRKGGAEGTNETSKKLRISARGGTDIISERNGIESDEG
ncbi:hypothetical protein FRC03_009480 [Tulasnella sp. 419]|nr:hypothetical protein FRC03_009480 [Tulasnella sp. 419]